ncbi:MAG: hypothetical protein KBC84_06390 [Proteobacteria bacterium]|nr:hypothetical protein [Pseudomonadota bacterium]
MLDDNLSEEVNLTETVVANLYCHELLYFLATKKHQNLILTETQNTIIETTHRRNWPLSLRSEMIRAEIKGISTENCSFFGEQWWEKRFLPDNTDGDLQIIRIYISSKSEVEMLCNKIAKQGFQRVFCQRSLWQRARGLGNFTIYKRKNFVVDIHAIFPQSDYINNLEVLRNDPYLMEGIYRLGKLYDRILLGHPIDSVIFNSYLFLYVMPNAERVKLNNFFHSVPEGKIYLGLVNFLNKLFDYPLSGFTEENQLSAIFTRWYFSSVRNGILSRLNLIRHTHPWSLRDYENIITNTASEYHSRLELRDI